jgi:DNA polymerase III subunit epsilon
MNKFYEELDSLKFCIFDLETTGGNQDRDEIIEIGVALVENFSITLEKNYLLKPRVKIPEFIQKLTSISNNDVKGCPEIEEVIDEILSLMKGRVLVAHNTSFDVPFFNSVLRRLGREELENKSICTNLMSKYLIPNLLNTNLSYMSKLFKVDHGKAHRALDDARATAKIFLIFLQIFKNRKIEKLNHLYYPKNKFEIDRINYKLNEDEENTQELIKSFKLPSPSILTLKENKGVIKYCLPVEQVNNDFIENVSRNSSSDTKNITIQYFGSFFESFYNFILSIMKLKKDDQERMIHDFCVLNSIDPKEVLNKESDKETKITKLKSQFIVAPHLVEDQLIIFNLATISSRNFSAFKITSHRKKLTQFINSRIARAKSSKPNIGISIQKLLRKYLENVSSSSSYLCSFQGMEQNEVSRFVDLIEDFSLEQDYPYDYPEKYI